MPGWASSIRIMPEMVPPMIPAVIAKINAVLVAALRSPAGEALTRPGFDIAALGPKEYAEFLRTETEKWGKVAKAANIRL